MKTVSNKFLIAGAVAAAALVIPGVLGPLAFQEAEASIVRGAPQSNNAASQEGVVNAQIGVNANVQTGDVCVQALASNSNC
jgi:hypothetical protein